MAVRHTTTNDVTDAERSEFLREREWRVGNWPKLFLLPVPDSSFKSHYGGHASTLASNPALSLFLSLFFWWWRF